MLALAFGLSVVPAIGSQGAGALGARQIHADALIVADSPDAGNALRAADVLAQVQVLELAGR